MKNLPFSVNLLFCFLLLLTLGCNSGTNSEEATSNSITQEQEPVDILQSAEVKNEAKSEIPSLPTNAIINEGDLPANEKHSIQQIVAIIKSTAESGLTEEEYTRLEEHTRVIEVALEDNGGNGGNDSTSDCKTVYDNCMNSHNCDEEATFCLCCAPCSIKYARCLVTIRTNKLDRPDAPATEGIGS